MMNVPVKTKIKPFLFLKSFIILIYIFFALNMILIQPSGANNLEKGPSLTFPTLIHLSGDTKVQVSDKIIKKGLIGMPLRGSLNLQTYSGQALLALDPYREIWIEPNSELEIPTISWESGELNEIRLKRGIFKTWRYSDKRSSLSLRKSSSQIPDSLIETSASIFPLTLSGDLIRFPFPLATTVFKYEPSQAIFNVYVLEGELEFFALHSDEKIILKAGQSSGFIGKIEKNKIIYDVLLQNKKSPQGKLMEVKTFDMNSLSFLNPEMKWIKHMQKENLEKQKGLQEKSIYVICHAPEGKYNQCKLECLSKSVKKPNKGTICISSNFLQCNQKRCLASGEWGDMKPLSDSLTPEVCKWGIELIHPCLGL